MRNAVAVFELPEAGASARFGDGSIVKVVLTNQNGEATAPLKSNDVPGKYQPKVTVNYLGQTSMVTLHQENLYPYIRPAATAKNVASGRISRLLRNRWFRIGVVAAGAIVATVVLTRGGSAPSGSGGGIIITPGTGTVGGGR